MPSSSTKHIFIFAGEKSGDLHGAHLIKALQHRLPAIHIEGVAGPAMRLHGIDGPLTMEDFEVMGLTDVLCSLPKLCTHFYKVRDHILASRPVAVVLIDYPGFNLRLAKALRQQGYKGKIIQYVSPTVWAWGRHRIDMMAKTLDLLLTIYPFEAACFAATPLKVAYVGNPLCEYIKNYHYDAAWRAKIGLPETDRLIALFPGSRQGEIARNLPLLLEAAARLLQQQPETIFGISCAHPDTKVLVDKLTSTTHQSLQKAVCCIPATYSYELMRDSRTAMAKSGTVTLELALHGRPTVVIYKLTRLNRLYAKYMLKLKLPNYCIVNILADKTVFPELIESGLTAQNLFLKLQALDSDGHMRTECLKSCQEIHQQLSGSQHASQHAAAALQEMLAC